MVPTVCVDRHGACAFAQSVDESALFLLLLIGQPRITRMARSKVVDFDYYQFLRIMQRAGNAGQRIDKTDASPVVDEAPLSAARAGLDDRQAPPRLERFTPANDEERGGRALIVFHAQSGRDAVPHRPDISRGSKAEERRERCRAGFK